MTHKKYISDHFTDADARRFDDEATRHERAAPVKGFHHEHHIKTDLPRGTYNPNLRSASLHPDFAYLARSSTEDILARINLREARHRKMSATHNPEVEQDSFTGKYFR